MAHYVQLWRGDQRVGELGPFASATVAAKQARAFAPCAGPGVTVLVVNAKVRRRNGTGGRSQSTMKKLGQRIKRGALNAFAPKMVRRPALAFAFALMDPKVPLVDKYLAAGAGAPLAAADGPLPLGDLAAVGITITKMSRLAKPRHYAQADRALKEG